MTTARVRTSDAGFFVSEKPDALAPPHINPNVSGLTFATCSIMPDVTTDIEKNTDNGNVNADIERFLLTGEALEIYDVFGFAELNRYLEDISHLNAGFEFEHLGISERRAMQQPRLIVGDQSFQFIEKRAVLKDASVTPADSIALLQLRGVMRSQSGLSSPGVDQLIADLRSAYGNENVSGVIIETNSGGGETIAGTMLKSAIQERNKPVVGFAHLAASAAFRALSGSDEIIGSGDAAEFGSIGTMISLDSKMLEKYRKRFADFYGTTAPGKNAEHRSALGGNFTGIQQRVDKLTESFQNEIRRDRPLQGSEKTISETLNGSVFAAMESKKRGLIDGIGSMQYAVKRVRALRSKYK